MPSRVIREGLISSEAVASLTASAEVLFVHLILIADDYGRHDARIPLLRAKLFPFKLDKVSDADVAAWLEECRSVGLVRLYEVGGKPYLEIPRFGQRMRAKVSKCPAPPSESAADDGQLPATCRTDDGHVSGTRRPESESESESELLPSEVVPPLAAAGTKGKAKTKKPAKEYPRNPLFDAIAEVCDKDPSIKTVAGLIGSVAAELAKANPPYTPEEVRDFGRRFRELCPHVRDDPRRDRPTPGELRNHIDAVRRQPARQSSGPGRVYDPI